tara:strand:+ start:4051 stop:4764 length:714 start_codon:yes stop_codon:yes gene_type:complete
MKILEIIAIKFFNLIDKFLHQPKILKVLKNITEEINVYVDVGAHKGTYTDLIIKNFQTKKILMFEPQEKIFSFLKNKYKNNQSVSIFNKALSEKKEFLNFNFNKHDLTSSLSTLDSNNSYLKLKAKLFGTDTEGMIEKKLKVETSTLFSLMEETNTEAIDLLKIDTEGHEFQVIKGIKDKIKNVRFILVEFHNDEIYVSYDPNKLHEFLISKNFKLMNNFKFPFTTWEDRLYMNLHK